MALEAFVVGDIEDQIVVNGKGHLPLVHTRLHTFLQDLCSGLLKGGDVLVFRGVYRGNKGRYDTGRLGITVGVAGGHIPGQRTRGVKLAVQCVQLLNGHIIVGKVTVALINAGVDDLFCLRLDILGGTDPGEQAGREDHSRHKAQKTTEFHRNPP